MKPTKTPRRHKTGGTAICAYGPCGKQFERVWDGRKWPKYCSVTCSNRGQNLDRELVSRRAANCRAAWARRKAEAQAAGLTVDQLLEAKIEAYWRTVEDPGYYSGLRHVTPQSALQGEM